MKKQEIKVGILFSLTGTTSITERGQYQACLLAIRHINENGGINGKMMVPIVEDAASDPNMTRQKAEKLIISDGVTAIIGCYTAACRKAVIPVLETNNVLMFYPTINEGEEQHSHIFYSNSAPNQQLLDFIPWLIRHVGKTFYLIGSDYNYPREINRYVRLLVEANGGSVYDEQYIALGHQVFDQQFNEIRRLKPDIVFSSLVGDSCISYYQQHEQLGLRSSIASNVTAETEIKAINPMGKTDYYSSFSYFSTIQSTQNRRFITEFERIYGTDTVSSVMESAYNSIILLAEALKKIHTTDTPSIRKALAGLSIDAPQGKIKVDLHNQHVWLHSRIGKATKTGQFQIIWESGNLIAPIPVLEEAIPMEARENGSKAPTRSAYQEKEVPLLSELKALLEEWPFPMAYFNRHGVLLEFINKQGDPHSPLLKLLPGENVKKGCLSTSGIAAAFKKGAAPYEASNENNQEQKYPYIAAGFRLFGKQGVLEGVLGVCIPHAKTASASYMLKAMQRMIHLCRKLTEKKAEQIFLTDALYEITDGQPDGMFILNEETVLFKNKQGTELWEKKRDFVQSVFHELSIRSIKGERLLKREEPEGSYEIKIETKNALTYVYIKSTPRGDRRFSLKDRKNLTTGDLIGSSEAFLKTIELARSASKNQANTLLLGESGTGKEMFARAIHNESARRNKPFVAVNCGAISKELIHSELFGYAEGAFTGAKKGGHPGKFEMANGGTIFLDEIGEMPLELQTSLLRVLQEKEVVRVGGHKPIPLDVRIIAATNKDLFQEIAFNGSFRSDLYYRLNVFTIELTALRHRPEDIAKLSRYYLEEFGAVAGRGKQLSEEALAWMLRYNWPGNIRELCNTIERAFYMAGDSSTITPDHLPEVVTGGRLEKRQETLPFHHELQQINSIGDMKQSHFEKERQFYLQTLLRYKGNVSRSAKHLGISRTTLYQRMKEYQIRTGK